MTDQPFDTVDNPEFGELLIYVHHPALTIKIPGCHAIRRRAMKMGEYGIKATRTMFAVRCKFPNACDCVLISTSGTGLQD